MSSGSSARMTRLVAGRELSEQLRSTTFRAVTVVLVVAVAAIVLVPAAIGGGSDTKIVGVVGGTTPGMLNAADLAGRVAGIDNVETQSLPSVSAARQALRDGTIDVAVVNRQVILVKQEPISGVETPGTTLAESLAQLIGFNRALEAMPQSDRGEIAAGLKLPIRGVEASGRDLTSRITGVAVALVIYMFILLNGMKITQGVAEEKATRVVEVLLSAVRPMQLLTGKITGVGAAAALQLGAMVGTFLICGAIAGRSVDLGNAGQVVLAGVIWLIIGYLMYSTLFAAAGSLISRQSDASSVSTPLLLPLIVVFSFSVSVMFSEAGMLFEVLAYFPLTAPIAMPTLYAIGSASAGQFMISAAISLLFTIAAFRFAAIIFERAILRTGARVRLGQVFGSDAV